MRKSNLYILFFLLVPILGWSQIDTNDRWPVDKSKMDSVEALPDYDKMLFYKQVCWKSRLYNSRAALYFGAEALKLSQKLDDYEQEASILNYLGVVSRNMNNYPIALEYYFEANEIAGENGLTTEKAYAYNNIGDIYNREKNYKTSIKYINEALNLFTLDSNKAGMAYCNNQLGIVMRNMNKDSLALEHFFKTLKLRKELRDTIKVAVAYNSIGEIYHLQNKLEKARGYYENSFKLLEGTKDYRSVCIYYQNIGRYYLQLDSIEKAKKSLKKCFDLSKYFEYNDVSSNTASYLSDIYFDEFNFKEAYYYLKYHKTLSDSLKEEENTAKVTRMEMRHQYNQELKERELVEFRNYAILSSVILIFLAIVVGLFRINKVKQKANISLALKTEQIIGQQEEVRKYYEELKANNQTKDRFFSIIAHDLKNPFNAISGFAGLILESIEEKSFEGIEKYAQIIQRASEQNYDLLTNLLEWSRSQTGDIKFKPENFEIDKFICEVVELHKDLALQKNISINYNNSKLSIYADKNMLNTILRNLLSNAVKYSYSDKTINLNVEKNSKSTEFKVQDEGIGIKEDDVKKLFRIDEELSTPGTSEEKGTGLGLILCKEFVKKHNGEIWVESALEKGTTFYFTIPDKETS